MYGISKRLLFAYILDVVAILAFAFIGLGVGNASPNYRPFSLLDLSISFPQQNPTIPLPTLLALSAFAPAVVIAGVCFVLVPGLSTVKALPWNVLLRRKVWEWFVGWMGLALCLATEFLLVQGLKNAVGKPRPDLLSRCKPDLSAISQNYVGGYGQPLSARWVLVDHLICHPTSQEDLDNGFRSFPSGHSSTAFAGLLYLTLWLCSKFGVFFPCLPAASQNSSRAAFTSSQANGSGQRGPTDNSFQKQTFSRHRNEAAAPPAYLLFLAYIPLGLAFYIASTRYFDYKHDGFDIIAGGFVGCVTAWLAFYYYHAPLSQGSGWSWGPRSPTRAFLLGVGKTGWVEDDYTPSMQAGGVDEESGIALVNQRQGGLTQSVHSSPVGSANHTSS